MKSFLSCDWGTSSFRLRVVDRATLQFISSETNDKGILKIFELWKRSRVGAEGRFAFYLRVINDHIKILEQQTGQSLKNLPLIISGMAASSLGIIELDYKTLPVSADGHDLEVKKIKETKEFSHDIFLISGVRSDDDAMRGEETQLAGCEHKQSGEEIFVFPGTHSKHVTVKNGRVIEIKTYMTGEFFSLLSEKSILSSSVQRGNKFADKQNKKSFEEGVQSGIQLNLLHASFLVRTNQLFSKLAAEENYYYLSGLLIGNELRDLMESKNERITLVASGEMKKLYLAAFNVLGLGVGENDFCIEDADRALVKGQLRILEFLKN